MPRRCSCSRPAEWASSILTPRQALVAAAVLRRASRWPRSRRDWAYAAASTSGRPTGATAVEAVICEFLALKRKRNFPRIRVELPVPLFLEGGSGLSNRHQRRNRFGMAREAMRVTAVLLSLQMFVEPGNGPVEHIAQIRFRPTTRPMAFAFIVPEFDTLAEATQGAEGLARLGECARIVITTEQEQGRRDAIQIEERRVPNVCVAILPEAVPPVVPDRFRTSQVSLNRQRRLDSHRSL